MSRGLVQWWGRIGLLGCGRVWWVECGRVGRAWLVSDKVGVKKYTKVGWDGL